MDLETIVWGGFVLGGGATTGGVCGGNETMTYVGIGLMAASMAYILGKGLLMSKTNSDYKKGYDDFSLKNYRI